MTKVRISRGCIVVDGQPIPLLSGSMHFWRLNPASWAPILGAIHEMGLEVIDTYVAWEFHELAKGEFDFTGHTDPRRDLDGFLQLVAERGFKAIVRPGPFIYAEWVNMGVPTDVAAYHRLHPYFQERSSGYIAAVSAALVRHLATRGGPVVLLQPDNEVDPFEYCYEEQLGLDGRPGMFQEFLERRYGSIESLNRRWDTSLSDFASARPVMSLVNRDERYLARYYDFIDFRFDYVNRAVAWFRDEYRKNGIDVPILHNTYDIMSVQDARALADGVVDLVGTDAYPPNNFERFVASGESISHQRFLEFLRYYGTFGDTNFLAEFQSGIGHGLHYYSGVLMPNHFRLSALSALSAGVNAWNWYMLVNRDNWMMSPINEWGRQQRELFEPFKELVALYRRIDVPALRKLTRTGATFFLKHQILPEAESDPVLAALYDSGIDYQFFDLESGRVESDILFYAGAGWLPRACQQRLADYVESGGDLVFFQTYPLRDESFEFFNGLGIREPDGALDEPFLDHLATEVEVEVGSERIRTRAPLFTWGDDMPGVPIFGTRVDADIRDSDFEENRYLRSRIIGRRYVVGYRERRGRGSLTVLGIRPTAPAIVALHRLLGVPIPALPGGGLQAAAFGYENPARRRAFVILTNTANQEVNARVEIFDELLESKAVTVQSLRRVVTTECAREDGRVVYVRLPAKDGTVLEVLPRPNR